MITWKLQNDYLAYLFYTNPYPDHFAGDYSKLCNHVLRPTPFVALLILQAMKKEKKMICRLRDTAHSGGFLSHVIDDVQ